MSRYIDLEELDRQFLRLKAERYGSNDTVLTHAQILNLHLSAISATPLADVVAVKHGKWIHYGVDISEHPLRCSLCGYGNHHMSDRYVKEMDYCPHCGSRMDGES